MNIKQIILCTFLTGGLMFSHLSAQAQHKKSSKIDYGVSAELHYNDVTYNGNTSASAGELDFHKLFFTGGYKFNERLVFKSKLKIEHLFSGPDEGEVIYLDKAYLDYRLKPNFGVRGGLYSVPLGGSKFKPSFGIETSPVDKYMYYSWRELALGFYGEFRDKLSYEAYVMTGLNPEEFSSKSGIFGARKSQFTSSVDNFAVSARLGYDLPYGFEIGASGIISDLQSKEDYNSELDGANFKLIESHLAYQNRGFSGRMLGVYSTIAESEKINEATDNHIGSSQYGMLLELGYDLFRSPIFKKDRHLIVFTRGEVYDTQYTTEEIVDDPTYERYGYNFGVIYEPMDRVGLKADFQIIKSKGKSDIHQMNLGLLFRL